MPLNLLKSLETNIPSSIVVFSTNPSTLRLQETKHTPSWFPEGLVVQNDVTFSVVSVIRSRVAIRSSVAMDPVSVRRLSMVISFAGTKSTSEWARVKFECDNLVAP